MQLLRRGKTILQWPKHQVSVKPFTGSENITGPLEKFVDSPYCYELELCRSAVTVSFSKYFPWQVMHLLQCSTHFSKICHRQFAASFRRIVVQAVLNS
jgi:hypothetical protein